MNHLHASCEVDVDVDSLYQHLSRQDALELMLEIDSAQADWGFSVGVINMFVSVLKESEVWERYKHELEGLWNE